MFYWKWPTVTVTKSLSQDLCHMTFCHMYPCCPDINKTYNVNQGRINGTDRMSWKPWFSSQKPWKASCAPLSVRSHKSRDYDIKAWCYFNQSNNTISFNLYSSYFHLKDHPLMTPNDLEMTPIWPKNDQKILENGRSNKIFRRKMQFLREFTCLYFSSSHLSIISLVNQSLILGLIFFLFKIFSYEGKKKR